MKFNEIKIGISAGVTWAWGVSLGVGLKILTTMGAKSFIIWASANTLALAIFGFVVSKCPAYLKFQEHKLIKCFMIIIQIFCIWVNTKTLIEFINIPWTVIIVALTFIVTYLYKFKFVIDSNQWQYGLYFLSLLLIIFTREKNIFINIDNTNYLWLIPASIGLICGPFLDGQHFQRMRVIQKGYPYYIGSLVFGIYMVLIFFVGQSNGPFSKILLISTIIWVVTSTLNSCVSALQEMAGDKKAVIISILALVSLPLFYQQSVITIWSWYAIGRIFIVIPLIFIAWRQNGRIKETGIFINIKKTRLSKAIGKN